MDRMGRNRIRAAAAGALLLLLMMLTAAPACAAKEKTLTAACPSRCSEIVYARKSKNVWVLSLPGFWDPAAVTLELNDSAVITLGKDGTQFRAGEPGDLTQFVGETVTVWDEKQKQACRLIILQGSPIPALFLEADGEDVKEIGRSKKKSITEGRAAYYEEDGTVSYDGEIEQLKGRGNITYAYPKKPYQFKLKKKASLSGMEKAKTWILLANWTDLSLLRNQIALDMSRAIGLRFAVGCVPVDVWINGNYNGLYLMTEKIQIGKNRVAITDLEEETEKVNPSPLNPGKIVKEKKPGFNIFRSYPAVKDPEDITGGYIATIEKNHRMQNNDLPGFRTDEKLLSVQIKEPTYPSTAQTEYFGGRVLEMHRALLAKDGVNPETGKSYEEYLDADSFARKYLIEDWVKNYDFLGGSQYIYKDSDLVDPLIYAGPAWDYDLAFGNMRDKGHLAASPFLANFKKDNNLYWLLYRKDGFRKRLGEIWRTVFRPAAAVLLGEVPAEPGSIIRPFDEYRARIEASAAMNFKRWGTNDQATAYEAGGNFNNATKYLKRWIKDRTVWMDANYGTEE